MSLPYSVRLLFCILNKCQYMWYYLPEWHCRSEELQIQITFHFPVFFIVVIFTVPCGTTFKARSIKIKHGNMFTVVL